MRFRIGDKTYNVGALDKITIAMALELQTETAAMGHPVTMGELHAMGERVGKLPLAEQHTHMDTMWLTAVTIWATRRLAGEPLTFDEAIQSPMADVTFIPDPQDHKPPDPRKAPPRKGSGAGVKRPAARK